MGLELLLCSITLLAVQNIEARNRDWSLTLLSAVLTTLQREDDPVTSCAVNEAGAGAKLLALLKQHWVGAPPGGHLLLDRLLAVAGRLPTMDVLQAVVLHMGAMVAAGASRPDWATCRGQG